MKKIIIQNTIRLSVLLALVCKSSFLFSQKHEGWTQREESYYQTAKGLCNFIASRSDRTLNKTTMFQKYIYMDYILQDTDQQRIQKRLKAFDTLMVPFRRYIDSVGLNNLEAKPVRFFQDNKSFYRPFAEELKDEAPNVLVYYNKADSSKPLGCLYFDDKTSKLISWILINQGGTYYFLTFNLI